VIVQQDTSCSRESIRHTQKAVRDPSRSFRLLGIRCGAFLAHDFDSAKNVIAILHFEDLSNLLGDSYSSPSNYFCKEGYLFLVEFHRHLLSHRG
jgi:hypothetical protein